MNCLCAAVGCKELRIEGLKVVCSPSATKCTPQSHAFAVKGVALPLFAKVEICVDVIEGGHEGQARGTDCPGLCLIERMVWSISDFITEEYRGAGPGVGPAPVEPQQHRTVPYAMGRSSPAKPRSCFSTSECGAANKQLGVVVGVKNFVKQVFRSAAAPVAPWQCSTTKNNGLGVEND